MDHPGSAWHPAPLAAGDAPDADGASRGPSRTVLAGLLLLLAAAVLTAHWPVLSSRAILFDDHQYLLENPLVQRPGRDSAWRFIREVLAPSTVQGYYQPLTMISLMLDWAGGGRPDNLYPFKRTNLALHVLNTGLVAAVLYLLFGEPWIAAGCALLFGVHPLTVEPVAWIAERKTLLATFFSLVCLILNLRWSIRAARLTYAACLTAYLLALLSKPTSTPLPVLMLLLDFWPLRRLSTRAVLAKIPFLAVGAASAVITIVSQARTAAIHVPGEYPAGRIPLILCHNIVFYLRKIVWPAGLSQHYPFPEPFTLSTPAVLAGVAGTVVLIAALLISLRRTRAFLTGWLFFFAAMLPTMGIIGFTMVIAADKYAYLPSVGLLLPLAWLLAGFWRGRPAAPPPWGRRVGTLACLTFLGVAEALATRHYLGFWKDTETLYRRMHCLAPDSPAVNSDLGAVLYNLGRTGDAMALYKRAIELSPFYAEAYYNRGMAHADSGDWAAAIADFTRAIEVRPGDPVAFNNRGNARLHAGDLPAAIADYTAAIRLRPDYAEAFHNRGFARGRSGDFEAAIEDLSRAIELRPDYAQAYCNRAVARYSLQAYDLAWADVRACRRLGGTPPPALLQALTAATGRIE